MSPRLARFAFTLLGLIALLAARLAADAVGYGGRHEYTANSVRYEAVHVHDWDWLKTDALFARTNALDAFFSADNQVSSLVVRDRATGKTILETPAPALTRLWISPDEKFLVGLSNVMLRNPVQLAVWRLPSGKLVWREPISPEVVRLSAAQIADNLLAYPANAAALAPLTRKHGADYIVDLPRSNIAELLGPYAWADLRRHLAPHPYSGNFSRSVTNHVFWYREPDPALRLDPAPEPGAIQLSLLDPLGIRFRILLPADESAPVPPAPATPYPAQDIRLTDPGALRPDDSLLRSIEKSTTPPAVILPPDDLGPGPAGQLHQTLRSRLQITEPYSLFLPDETETSAALSLTRYLYLVVPDLHPTKSAREPDELAQLVGVEIAGRRCVLVNVIPAVASRAETDFWLWHDGGPRIFQLLYDVESRAITHWRFNGGF